MLIDDDEDDREILLSVIQNILPTATHTIANNGQDALSKLNRSPMPHLIFLDLNVPLINGSQFLAARRENAMLNSIPVVILSTSSDQPMIKETIELGAWYFVTKPDKYSACEGALRDVLKNLFFSNK